MFFISMHDISPLTRARRTRILRNGNTGEISNSDATGIRTPHPRGIAYPVVRGRSTGLWDLARRLPERCPLSGNVDAPALTYRCGGSTRIVSMTRYSIVIPPKWNPDSRFMPYALVSRLSRA